MYSGRALVDGSHVRTVMEKFELEADEHWRRVVRLCKVAPCARAFIMLETSMCMTRVLQITTIVYEWREHGTTMTSPDGPWMFLRFTRPCLTELIGTFLLTVIGEYPPASTVYSLVRACCRA